MTRFEKLLLFLIVVGNLLRFVGLEKSPRGFYFDESSNALHLICLAESGRDANGQSYPLFANQFEPGITGTGTVPPTHLYLGLPWVKIFGPSVASVRSLSAFFMALFVLGVFLFARLFLPLAGALLCALSATLSPLAFQLSRFSSMTPFELAALVFALTFFFRSNRSRDAALSGVFFSLALYSYPPSRAQLPILALPILWLKANREPLSPRFLFVAFLGCLIPLLPWFPYLATPEAQERTQSVALFGKSYLALFPDESPVVVVFRSFMKNFYAHLTPQYLFLSGDKNLRHSTQAVGELSWLDLLALVFAVTLLIRKRWPPRPILALAIFCLFGIFGGITAASLTWQGIPHSLRSSGAVPFFSILSGIALWMFHDCYRKTGERSIAAVAILFLLYFGLHYATVYPEQSKLWWFSPMHERLKDAATEGSEEIFHTLNNVPTVSQRYYWVAFGKETCATSANRLKQSPQRPIE